jgi:hypothetical protein
MDMSNHSRLRAERATAATAAHEGLIQWIMRPFENLHRQSWSAPWETGARCKPRRR